MKLWVLCWMTLSLGLLLGCRSAVPPVGTPYTQAPPGPTPNPAETTPSTGTLPSAPPSSVAALDMAVADAVRQTLDGEPALTSASKHVAVTVNKGVVTVRGIVPSAAQRDELVERIGKIPGVDRVDDQLHVGKP